MHRLFMEELYYHAVSESPRVGSAPEGNTLRYETFLPRPHSEEPRPVDDLARSYYDERNPFLSELAASLPPEMVVLPVLAKVNYGFTGFLSGRAILEYSLRAAVNDTFLDSGKLGRLIQLEDGNWFILLQRDLKGDTGGILTAEAEIDRMALELRCAKLRERFRSLWRCDLVFFVGSQIACRDLAAEYEVLAALSREAHDEAVFFSACDAAENGDGGRQPDYSIWTRMLFGGDAAALVKEVTRFLVPLNRSPRVDLPFLLGFQQDFLQMVYTVLKEKDISAHSLYVESEAATLFDRACRSVDDMVAWVAYVTTRTLSCLSGVSMAQSIVEQVRKFVIDNLDNDLTRKSIASHLRMNPDYLARVFKKETGLSIYEFVQNERITVAKGLLAKTETSVCGIATQLGYTNFSHFSETFRKCVGKSPADFRKAAAKS